MYGPSIANRLRSSSICGGDRRRERLGIGPVVDHPDAFGLDPVEALEILTRRLARDDDGGRSAERPLEPSLPSCVVMRSGLGHHVAGEVVHDDDDARRRGRRHDEVRRQDDVGRTRQPFELREARSRTERAVEARRETGRPLREVGSPTGEASRTRPDPPHIQVPGDEPRLGIGWRQRAQHGPRVLPDPRPAGIDRGSRVDHDTHWGRLADAGRRTSPRASRERDRYRKAWAVPASRWARVGTRG